MEIKADIESSSKCHLFLGWWKIFHQGDWHSLERARHYLHGFRMAIDGTHELSEEADFLYDLCCYQTEVYAVEQAQEAA